MKNSQHLKIWGRKRLGLIIKQAKCIRPSGLCTLILAVSFLAPFSVSQASDQYTPEQYIKDRGLKKSQLIPRGKLRIAGTRMQCGKRPTVLDPTLDDYGGAFDTFIILNPRLLKRLPKQVRLWVYAHECAHQFQGGDEAKADCFAIKRGVRYGWLNSSGMQQICKFIWSAPASTMHPPGPERCVMMRKCFKEVKK